MATTGDHCGPGAALVGFGDFDESDVNMTNIFYRGQQVRVRHNVFSGHADPDTYALQGEIVRIVDLNNVILVCIDGKGEYQGLYRNEVEEAEPDYSI